MDQPEQGFRQQKGPGGQDCPQQDAEPHAVPEIAPEASRILCAGGLSQRDAKTDAGPLYKPQGEKIQRIGRAYRGQGRVPDKPPHHHRIHKGIQLLEQRPRHQRQGEKQDLPDGTALRQIHRAAVCHKVPPESFWPLVYSCFFLL